MKGSGKFRFTYHYSGPCKELVLVGNVVELGMWDIGKGITLMCRDFPTWSTPVPICLPIHKPISYAFVFLSEKGVVWEKYKSGQESRNLKIDLYKVEECERKGKEYIITNEFYQPPGNIEMSGVRLTKVRSIMPNSPRSPRRTKELEISRSNSPTPLREKLTTQDRVIMGSFLLPYQIELVEGSLVIVQSRQILYPMLHQAIREAKLDIVWVGGIKYIPKDKDQKEKIKDLLKSYKCYPVFFKPNTTSKFMKFMDTILGPLFHDFVPLRHDIDLCNPDLWGAYKQVNSKLANKILFHYTEKSMIWLQDFYFLMVPYCIISSHSSASLGLFIHSNFPSGEIFKVFPYREELLRSMLCCNLIGFHLYEYARSFLNSCARLYGLNAEFRGGGIFLTFLGRQVHVRVGHIGIQPEIINSVIQSQAFRELLEEKEKILEGKYVIASIDKNSVFSNLISKIRACKQFVEDYGAPGGRLETDIELLQSCAHQEQYALEDMELNAAYKNIKSEVVAANEFFTQKTLDVEGQRVFHIDLKVGSLPIEERICMYALADTLLITTLKDGFSLRVLEYILTRSILGKSTGTVVISEFTGCATALSGLIRINPYQIQSIYQGIETAIFMQLQDKLNSFKSDLEYIKSHDTKAWVIRFLQQLKATKVKQDAGREVFILGLEGCRMISNADFAPINLKKVEEAYLASSNRILIFDNEGTLISFLIHQKAELFGLSPELHQSLERISKDLRNSVYVVSGRNKAQMEHWYGDIEGIGLGAEYGFWYKWLSKDHWESLFPMADWGWMNITVDIMGGYCSRTDGSYIEKKDSSIVWNYKAADPEWGLWQSKELKLHLKADLKAFAVTITMGKMYVEVRPRGINKGGFVKMVIHKLLENRNKIDFVLCVGDDIGDESMFRRIDRYRDNKLAGARIFTSTVKRKPSAAKYYFDDSTQVRKLITSLNILTTKVHYIYI